MNVRWIRARVELEGMIIYCIAMPISLAQAAWEKLTKKGQS